MGHDLLQLITPADSGHFVCGLWSAILPRHALFLRPPQPIRKRPLTHQRLDPKRQGPRGILFSFGIAQEAAASKCCLSILSIK